MLSFYSPSHVTETQYNAWHLSCYAQLINANNLAFEWKYNAGAIEEELLIHDDLLQKIAASLVHHRVMLRYASLEFIATVLPFIPQHHILLSRSELRTMSMDKLKLLVKHGFYQLPKTLAGASEAQQKRGLYLRRFMKKDIVYQCWDEIMEFIDVIEEESEHHNEELFPHDAELIEEHERVALHWWDCCHRYNFVMTFSDLSPSRSFSLPAIYGIKFGERFFQGHKAEGVYANDVNGWSTYMSFIHGHIRPFLNPRLVS